MQYNDKLILAVPKGRILSEVMPIIYEAGIEPEAAFGDEMVRQLRFTTNIPYLDIIRVRSFDVATFVAFGAAHMGVVGNDVLLEFDYSEIYAPLDLKIGHCRISVAEPKLENQNEDLVKKSSIKVATKYPKVTRKYFSAKGIQAECIKLSGAIELAPQLGLCRKIVDLISTGATLEANGLVEMEKICDVTSKLAVNRIALKTGYLSIEKWVEKFSEVVDAPKN